MTNTVSTATMGGLGNTLFQIATGLSISLRDNLNFLVNSSNHHGAHFGIGKYTNNILKNVKFSDMGSSFKKHVEVGFRYNEIPKVLENIELVGYFQSEKYFVEHRNEILDFFSPTSKILEKIENNYKNILNNNTTTSLHVRRGDYLSLPNHHPVLPTDYYEESVSKFDSNQMFLIFSDDINWCKDNFEFISNKIFVDNLEDYEELYLMSMCNNNIIANSSFSWWGSWLNKNEDKTVVAPKKWFGPAYTSLDTTDLYINNWIKI